MKITLSRTAHAPFTTYKCVSLTASRIIGTCIEMADLFAVAFDPNYVYEMRTSKTEVGGGGGAKSLNFRRRAKSLRISPGGGQIPGGAISLRHRNTLYLGKRSKHRSSLIKTQYLLV